MLWLNTAVKTLWPYYNNAVGKMVLEQVGPALDPILAKVRPAPGAQPPRPSVPMARPQQHRQFFYTEKPCDSVPHQLQASDLDIPESEVLWPVAAQTRLCRGWTLKPFSNLGSNKLATGGKVLALSRLPPRAR